MKIRAMVARTKTFRLSAIYLQFRIHEKVCVEVPPYVLSEGIMHVSEFLGFPSLCDHSKYLYISSLLYAAPYKQRFV